MNNIPEKRIHHLLSQIRSGAATEAEFQELTDALEAGPAGNEVQNSIRAYFDRYNISVPEADPLDAGWQALLQRVLEVDKPVREYDAIDGREPGMMVEEPAGKRVWLLRRWRAVAAAVLIIGAGAYLWMSNGRKDGTPAIAAVNDVTPGKNGAVLTLADGSALVLDTLGNGVVAQQGNARAVLNNGQLTYSVEEDGRGAAAYHTLSTPRGRIFRLTLSDGTRVWLNSASSLRFPARFPGEQRVVEVSGEVYFEVAHNAASPFVVRFGGAHGQAPGLVEVLGTHFNLNAYPDERSSRTTLVEGTVKVSTASGQEVLEPGQQSELHRNGRLELHKEADVRDVLSWKNGVFSFGDRSLEEVMRELARWYDIDVVYENGVPDIGIGGRMGRDVNLSSVLDFLKGAGLQYRLEAGDKRLIIIK